jgi:hypothetical protein
MKQTKLNNSERENWVNNDEGLYNWFKSSRLSMREFIKQNKSELDECILRVLNGEKKPHFFDLWIRSIKMRQVYLKALEHLERRALTCLNASKQPNSMVDCKWSDLRFKASWLSKHYEAIEKIEQIKQRLAKRSNRPLVE